MHPWADRFGVIFRRRRSSTRGLQAQAPSCHSSHFPTSRRGWLIVVLGDADTLNTVSCRSASPRAILSRAAYSQVTPAAQRRADLRATPATLPGVAGRPTRASAVSSATETTVACEKCRDKGTAQNIMLPMSVVPMIASFFMRFLSSVTYVPPILKTICLRWPRSLR